MDFIGVGLPTRRRATRPEAKATRAAQLVGTGVEHAPGARGGKERVVAGLGIERESAEEVEEAELVSATVEDVAQLHGKGGPHGP